MLFRSVSDGLAVTDLFAESSAYYGLVDGGTTLAAVDDGGAVLTGRID